MVDKIDRPEAPAPWRIKEPARTKDDRHSQQQEESKEQKKEKFEKRSEGTWQKFDGRTMVIRPMSVAVGDIRGFRFRNVTMHSGVATLEADLVWTNGRVSDGTMLRLAGFEEYIRAKRLRIGESVPRELWAKGDVIEIGIPQERTPSGSFSVEDMERETRNETVHQQKQSLLAMLGLEDRKTGQFQWAVLILYILIATGLVLGIHALITMTRV